MLEQNIWGSMPPKLAYSGSECKSQHTDNPNCFVL